MKETREGEDEVAVFCAKPRDRRNDIRDPLSSRSSGGLYLGSKRAMLQIQKITQLPHHTYNEELFWILRTLRKCDEGRQKTA